MSPGVSSDFTGGTGEQIFQRKYEIGTKKKTAKLPKIGSFFSLNQMNELSDRRCNESATVDNDGRQDESLMMCNQLPWMCNKIVLKLFTIILKMMQITPKPRVKFVKLKILHILN